MGLLAPLALAFVPVLAAITALYWLRLRRPETGVSSLHLWQALLRDREANAAWSRLNASLLWLLQLGIAAALILALARPWAATPQSGGRNLILILDTSAGMGSTDEPGGHTRLDEARRLAGERIAALPGNGTALLIAGGNHATLVSPATDDRTALRRALDGLHVEPTGTDLHDALALAAGLAPAQPDPEVVVYSDGRFPDPSRDGLTIPAPLRFVAVGTRGANQAIVALSLRRNAATLSLFAQVLNASDQPVNRRLDIALDGVAWAGRNLSLPPGTSQTVLFDEVPPATGQVHAHLAGSDDLAVDDDAWTVNRSADPVSALLVSDGNRFLQNALVLLPNVNLSRSTPAEYSPDLTATLTVFDRVVPTGTLPTGNLLFIAPPTSTLLFDRNGSVTEPAPSLPPPPAGADGNPASDPILRYTDLSNLHVAQAARIERTAWARTVLGSDQGPLILAGETGGRRIVIIAFDLHDSDLPLQADFPLLIRNLVGYLSPDAAGGLAVSVPAGAPVALVADKDEGVTRLSVAGPDGTLLADYAVQPTETHFQFTGTSRLGLYVVSQWAGAGVIRREGFTVNLFAPAEARLLPVQAPALPPSRRPAGVAVVESARVEWWPIAAALALLVLVAEWLLTHRLGLRRLGQRFARRPEDHLANP